MQMCMPLFVVLCRADGDENAFVFIMPSLMEYLEKMQQKDSLKSYYNIQILKYEASLVSGVGVCGAVWL